VETALALVGQIEDPVEYVNAFISILRMVIPGPRTKQILKSIYDAITEIPSTYERVEMLIGVVPCEQYGEKGTHHASWSRRTRTSSPSPSRSSPPW